jgi:iron complex outermembrane receptor protein
MLPFFHFKERHMLKRVGNQILAGLALIAATTIATPGLLTAQVASQTQDQTATASGQGGGELEKITVTGYVVPRVGEGPQPVVTLDRNFIERQGDQSVSDVLQRLPQNYASFTPQVNAGASFSPGASTVNLYGLGVNSNLVLLDGHRSQVFPFPQNGFQNFIDLNQFPLAAVDHIEVLKDGASAVYGSDAIAGVVNIITKSDYNGADLRYHWGISQRGDYEINQVQLTAGISKNFNEDSKLSVLASFSFYESSPIDLKDRWNDLDLDHTKRGHDLTDLRSSNSPWGSFTDPNTGTSYTVPLGFRGTTPAPTDFIVDPTGNFTNKFQPIAGIEIVPREERYGGMFKINYQPVKYVQVFDEFIANHLEEKATLTNQPMLASAGLVVPANNPFNTLGSTVGNLLWTNGRVPDLGYRGAFTTVDSFRNLAGIRLINLPKNWFVEATFLWGESDGHTENPGSVITDELQAALNGQLPGFVGQFFDPFASSSTGSNVNARLAKRLVKNPVEEARTGIVEWAIKAGGEVFDLPAGPVTVGFGAEYRSEDYVDRKERDLALGRFLGLGGSGNQNGRDYVRSAYGELTVPILGSKWSFPGGRALEFVISERYDDYSTFGEAAKPKFSIRYKPFDDLTFRASYSEGFRAPSLPELFAAKLTAFTTIIDPNPPPGASNTYTVTVISGGNPRLQPENSYSYYLGAVWTPGSNDPEHSWWGWANGFRAYVDWVEIQKRNTINTVGTQFVVNNPGLFPGAVTRDVTGHIATVFAPFQNLGAIKVDAFDFGFSYDSKEYAWGKLAIAADASYAYHVSQQNVPRGQVIDITDFTAAGGGNGPDFRLTGSVFYSKTLFGSDTFQTGLTLNFTDSEHDVNDFRGLGQTLPQFVALTGLSQTHTIGNWITFDWQISYAFGKPAEVTPVAPKPGYDKEGKRIVGEQAIRPRAEGSSDGIRRWLAGTKFIFGINNIADTRPPFADNSPAFDVQAADSIGRYFYVELEKKF